MTLRSFKKMHHDKCIEGKNRFAPCDCECFCYSKQFLPEMHFAELPNINLSFVLDSPSEQPIVKRIELKRMPGPPCDDGYYSYIKEIS